MKKKLLYILIPLAVICLIAIILVIILLNKRPTVLDYDKTAELYSESRMLEFDETYYFRGTENVEDDMVTGTVWRVDYNGHVSAFKFHFAGDYFDQVDFNLSKEETKKIWEYADSLEGDFVPSDYEGYAYGFVLYKYNDKGEKVLKKFSGLSADYPSSKEIFDILDENYNKAL